MYQNSKFGSYNIEEHPWKLSELVPLVFYMEDPGCLNSSSDMTPTAQFSHDVSNSTDKEKYLMTHDIPQSQKLYFHISLYLIFFSSKLTNIPLKHSKRIAKAEQFGEVM